jgi:hypothetical protein
VYRAGPLTLVGREDLAQHPEERAGGRRTSGTEAIVVLTGRRPAVLSVDRASRERFSLQFTPIGPGHSSPLLSDGRSAVRFRAWTASASAVSCSRARAVRDCTLSSAASRRSRC